MSQAHFAVVAARLRRLCQHPLPALSPETALADIPGLDSIRLLELVALVEEEVRLEVETAALDQLWRVQDLLDALAVARPLA